MRRDIDIDSLMADTWLTVAQLRHGAKAPDGQALYQNCCAQVDSVREALERAGYDSENITHISYAQCALLDEAVMNRKPTEPASEKDDGEEIAKDPEVDEGLKAWRAAPLQARYFGTLRAGGALYDRIAEVLRQPSPVPAVLTCYQRVLALGFQGQFSLSGVGQGLREEILASLNERVPALETGVSLVVHQAGKRRNNILRSVWFWIVLAVVLTVVVWAGSSLWLQSLLHQQLPELH
ncbi:type VI secretion system protein TssL, short form [Lelliottia wanjuensis]|uniref:type VI secretion system protein TssL, short form n=1 Tax=Lelliottia wanjuensis TaxID=3050585 RepID=UPI00254D5C78|nr:type VI secretion system protein TssL, short form [Lelliottia sp. V104_15]MDK9605804.1 type VI secretion system protein TssL, short form [Lelliottia sp. V104_15]